MRDGEVPGKAVSMIDPTIGSVISAFAFPEDVLSEELLREYVDLLVRVVEAAGALIIFAGALIASVRFAVAAVRPRTEHEFTRVRLGLGRYLALGLEFQLASDILSTAVAPTFEEIAKLAAIATIRTALNYFLGKEIEKERQEVDGGEADGPVQRPAGERPASGR